MSRLFCVALMTFAVVAAFTSLGCGSKQQDVQSTESESSSSTNVDQSQSDIDRELAKLSEEDRKLALAQKVCPVTGEPLGSMGVPIKVTVDGRSVFICCEGCEEELKKNFDEYVAKLEKPSDAMSK